MGNDNLPATAETRSTAVAPRNKAQEQRDRIDKFMEQVEQRRGTIEPSLRQAHVPYDLFVAGCRRAFMRDPKLVECTPASFLMAVMDCARIGLLPDGKKAAIVSFNQNVAERGQPKRYVKVAQLVPMYQGFLEVMYRAGVVRDCHAQVIYEGEEEFLDYDVGDEPFVRFRPPLTRDDTKPIIGAFARASSIHGGKWVEIMGGSELRKVGAVNKAAFGPGKDWPGEMARKAPLRRLQKFLPQSVELTVLMEIDDKSYLEAPEAPQIEGRAIPDADLLGDAPYVPLAQPSASEDDLPEDDETDPDLGLEFVADPGADPVTAIEAALRGAPDVDALEDLYHAIKVDVVHGWTDLLPTDRARIDLLAEQLREQLEPGAAPRFFIANREGRAREYPNGEAWKNAMLAKLASPVTADTKQWWGRNLIHVKEACAGARADAGRVIAVAAAKGLEGCDALAAEHGPFS